MIDGGIEILSAFADGVADTGGETGKVVAPTLFLLWFGGFLTGAGLGGLLGMLLSRKIKK